MEGAITISRLRASTAIRLALEATRALTPARNKGMKEAEKRILAKRTFRRSYRGDKMCLKFGLVIELMVKISSSHLLPRVSTLFLYPQLMLNRPSNGFKDPSSKEYQGPQLVQPYFFRRYSHMHQSNVTKPFKLKSQL